MHNIMLKTMLLLSKFFLIISAQQKISPAIDENLAADVLYHCPIGKYGMSNVYTCIVKEIEDSMPKTQKEILRIKEDEAIIDKYNKSCKPCDNLKSHRACILELNE